MAIAITAIHKRRIITQIEQNLIGLQANMLDNAQTHRSQALVQNPALATLQGFVQSSAQSYLTRLQWVIDLRANPVKKQRLLDMLASVGWAEQEIIDLVQGLRQAAVALRDAPKTTYAEIIAACDAVIAAVDMPPSLWPE